MTLVKPKGGKVDIGDIGAGTVTSNLTGDITAAVKTNPSGASSNIALTWPAFAASPVVQVTVESLGTVTLDNDFASLIIANVTPTGCNVFFEETAAVGQNLRLHISLTPR